MLHDDLLNLVDNLQQVELCRPPSDIRYFIDFALQRKSSLPEQRQYFKPLLQCWARWYLPLRQMPAIPQRGDEIHDSENRHWIIHETRFSSLSQTWFCLAYYFDVHFELDDYVDLLRFSTATESSGVPMNRWTLFQSGIPAKFASVEQKREMEKTAENRNLVKNQTLQTLLLRGPIELSPLDRLRYADGTYYQIQRIRHPESSQGWIIVDTEKIA